MKSFRQKIEKRDLGVERSIILKQVINKYNMRVWTEFIYLRLRISADLL